MQGLAFFLPWFPDYKFDLLHMNAPSYNYLGLIDWEHKSNEIGEKKQKLGTLMKFGYILQQLWLCVYRLFHLSTTISDKYVRTKCYI